MLLEKALWQDSVRRAALRMNKSTVPGKKRMIERVHTFLMMLGIAVEARDGAGHCGRNGKIDRQPGIMHVVVPLLHVMTVVA